MCQHCTDVNYRRISIFSTHRYYLFLISFAISNFVHACGKIFICLKYVWIKNKFVKTEGRQTSSSRAGALFLKKETLTLKRSVYCLLSGYRFFSNTNMNKKIFLFASRCTWKRTWQIFMKRNPSYTGEDSPVSLFPIFGHHCLGADTMTKKIFILRFFWKLNKKLIFCLMSKKSEFEFTFS